MLRNTVCSVILLGIIWAMHAGLKTLQGVLGFEGYMIFAAIGVAAMVTAAYSFDYWSARRSRR
jgi:hypothetical protein